MIARRSLMINEPDVALTDYALAVETAILAGLLYRAKAPPSSFKTAFIFFYCAIGLAAIAGGTFHGFFTEESPIGAALWSSVMAWIGLAGYAAWGIGGLLLFSPKVANRIFVAAAIGVIAYLLVVSFYSRSFALAIAYYLPAVVFLTIGFVVQLIRRRDIATLLGTTGMLLTFVAAGVQHLGISLHSHYFNHNAFYHLLQGIALLLVFFAARRFVTGDAHAEVSHAHHQA
ncbi:MAG: hypothetical protein L0Z53_17460 [Acidobacteriales bacterium]|nr:hypothetical protein [Terriglobales bacterium]